MKLVHLCSYDFLWSIRDEGIVSEFSFEREDIGSFLVDEERDAREFFLFLLFVDVSIYVELYTASYTIGVAESFWRFRLDREILHASESLYECRISLK